MVLLRLECFPEYKPHYMLWKENPHPFIKLDIVVIILFLIEGVADVFS